MAGFLYLDKYIQVMALFNVVVFDAVWKDIYSKSIYYVGCGYFTFITNVFTWWHVSCSFLFLEFPFVFVFRISSFVPARNIRNSLTLYQTFNHSCCEEALLISNKRSLALVYALCHMWSYPFIFLSITPISLHSYQLPCNKFNSTHLFL